MLKNVLNIVLCGCLTIVATKATSAAVQVGSPQHKLHPLYLDGTLGWASSDWMNSLNYVFPSQTSTQLSHASNGFVYGGDLGYYLNRHFSIEVGAMGLPKANYGIQSAGLSAAGTSYLAQDNGSISNWWWNLGDTVLTSAYPAGFLVKDSSITVQLVVSTAEGCTSDTAKQVILVHGQPIANFQEAGVFCNGQVITYTDQSGSLPNETNSQWSWDFGDGASGSGVTVSHLYNSSGLMHVILTVTNSNGCKDTAQKVIPIEDLPLIKDSILNAGKLCSNEDVHLINLSTIPGYGSLHQLQIFWDYPSSSGGLVTTDTLSSINKAYTHLYPSFGVPDSLNKIIYIKAFNKSGCSTDFQHTITLRAVPKLHLDPLAPVCQEAPDYMLTGAYDIYHLGGALTLSGIGITNSPTFSPGIAGYGTWPIYYHDSSAFGCTTDTSQLIIVKPTPSIVTPAPQTTDPGYSITMPPSMVQGIGLSYEWIEIPDNNYPFAHYLNDNTLATPTAIRPEHDVNYWVKITTHPDGCVDSAMATLWVLNDIIIPNTITPNGDKVNDVWTIDGLSKFPHHHVEIFNRYGQLLFETNHYTPWDGTYKGKKLPFGTYYYIIELGEGRKAKTGYITIVY